MHIVKDVYNLELLKEGTPAQEVLRNSSLAYTNHLLANGLIKLDSLSRVYFTDKGKVAKKIGVKKFLELEKLEKKFLAYNISDLKWKNIIFCLLLILISLFIIYLNFFSK